MPQVGDATGADVGRHADVVVMGLWPSRGLKLMGFEIKAGRGDWLGELRTRARRSRSRASATSGGSSLPRT
jgi:hypothetical protein